MRASIRLSGSETAVIYEQSMASGFGQSCCGYFLLELPGHPKIKVLHGGYDTWVAKDLPPTTDVPSPTPAIFKIKPKADIILIDAATMMSALDSPSIALLDMRDVDERIGESSSPDGIGRPAVADLCEAPTETADLRYQKAAR